MKINNINGYKDSKSFMTLVNELSQVPLSSHGEYNFKPGSGKLVGIHRGYCGCNSTINVRHSPLVNVVLYKSAKEKV